MSARIAYDLMADDLSRSPARRMASMSIELQGIRFSEGTPHPDIVGATIPTEGPHGQVDAVIVGNRTILNAISGLSQRIFLHSWKDGRVFLVRTSSCHNQLLFP